MPAEKLEQLCLQCGLCCNGVIFADVRLQAGIEVSQINALGLPVQNKANPCLKQPCAALDGCRCTIYSKRPEHCRQFECALFKSAGAGEVSFAEATKVVKAAQRRASRVRKLLALLGNVDESVALKKRFERVSRVLDRQGADSETADLFGQLTLAMHDLNVLLSERFYPGA